METYARVGELQLTIEGYELEGLDRPFAGGFTRRTTVVRLHGDGHEGIGEDVVYDERAQLAFREGAHLPVAGTFTLDAFSGLLGGLELFPGAPALEAYHHYRRWGFESAALDLALRQAGRSLADALGRTPRPVTFVVSLRLPEPPSTDPLRGWLSLYPGLRFKLDPTSSWDDDLVGELAAMNVVETVDLKGAYRGTPVDQPADPPLYRRVAEAFPNAWIEDPDLTPETERVLADHRERITWDAPIHSVADIEALPFAPRALNVKPSRFGTVRALFAAYDFCEERGIAMYGGGQAELGPGRGQIQYLASLFHPDTPNDVAPREYNDPEPRPGLPTSPLDPPPASAGFRWQ
jgi:L-alanine-DL-glutamate epimerase-like enolase superfamily enzyme